VHDPALMDVVQSVRDLRQRDQLLIPARQGGRGPTLDELHGEPTDAVSVDGDDVRMVELMRELEFPSETPGLVLAAVVDIENLQRHCASRLGGRVRLVHGGVTTPAQRGVDDVAFELLADGKHHASVGRTSRGPFSPHDYLCAACRR
jgi:hypothetical protein